MRVINVIKDQLLDEGDYTDLWEQIQSDNVVIEQCLAKDLRAWDMIEELGGKIHLIY